MKRKFPESELIINADSSCFHLHVRPEQLADRIVLVSDPSSVDLVASHFETKECEVESREFRTITGLYQGKRITCLSYGFGSENIDIVINELDTLANIDYNTREEKENHRELTLVNIGISEGIQADIKPGTLMVSKKSIGFDGLLNFYAGRNDVCDIQLEKSFTEFMNWDFIKGSPYVVPTEEGLLKQIAKNDIACGYIVSCIGFYSPQGRGLRLPLENTNYKEKLASFEYDGYRINNIDMESASIIGMASLLGHRAVSCCLIEDVATISNLSNNNSFKTLIKLVLDRI
jgi:uridine phosphorylase